MTPEDIIAGVVAVRENDGQTAGVGNNKWLVFVGELCSGAWGDRQRADEHAEKLRTPVVAAFRRALASAAPELPLDESALLDIENVTDAATDGVWEFIDAQGSPVEVNSHDGDTFICSCTPAAALDIHERINNARFIAAARQAVPALLATVRQQQALVARLIHDDAGGFYDAGREVGYREGYAAGKKEVLDLAEELAKAQPVLLAALESMAPELKEVAK